VDIFADFLVPALLKKLPFMFRSDIEAFSFGLFLMNVDNGLSLEAVTDSMCGEASTFECNGLWGSGSTFFLASFCMWLKWMQKFEYIGHCRRISRKSYSSALPLTQRNIGDDTDSVITLNSAMLMRSLSLRL
jgi:hypothetical protein